MSDTFLFVRAMEYFKQASLSYKVRFSPGKFITLVVALHCVHHPLVICVHADMTSRLLSAHGELPLVLIMTVYV